MRRLPLLGLLLLVAIALASSGCFNPFDPRVATGRTASTPAPVPNTPQGAIKLFAWCWQNRDPAVYAEIFTDDYRFQFQPNDPYGDPYKDSPWIREYEMSAAQHIFVGGTDQPPASDIQITVDNNLIPFADGRVGKDPKWHKFITTNVTLMVKFEKDGAVQLQSISGQAQFYLVRGDSAAIPPELVARGFKPDPSRWWIERWEDGTVGGNALAPIPIDLARARRATTHGVTPGTVTFGQLKSEWF